VHKALCAHEMCPGGRSGTRRAAARYKMAGHFVRTYQRTWHIHALHGRASEAWCPP